MCVCVLCVVFQWPKSTYTAIPGHTPPPPLPHTPQPEGKTEPCLRDKVGKTHRFKWERSNKEEKRKKRMKESKSMRTEPGTETGSIPSFCRRRRRGEGFKSDLWSTRSPSPAEKSPCFFLLSSSHLPKRVLWSNPGFQVKLQ